MDAPLISVIVPVYKVEKYLDRCVQSIVYQTYRNLEIILVDDGSPDNCGTMCDAWAKKDPRIKVIHKGNGGGAQARNVGLDHASGELIAFLDSDDYLLPDMYEVLEALLRQSGSDIAECGYYVVENDQIPVSSEAPSVQYFSAEEALHENIRDRICRQLVWNKLYCRQVLDDVQFVEGKFIDDEFFTYRALGNANKIAVTSEKFYCYRQQQGSAMHQSYSTKWIDAVDAKQLRLLYLQNNFPTLANEARINLLFTCLYHGQMVLRYLSGVERVSALVRLQATFNGCSLPLRNALSQLCFTHRCWLRLARIHFTLCCGLRNLLRVGL